MDIRKFTDSYDLYRPTLSTTWDGRQQLAEPDAATASAQPCLFFPKPGQMQMGETGPMLDYDAYMLVPPDADLEPDAQGSQPDHVTIGGQTFTVLVVWDVAGRGGFQKALMKERMA